MVINHIFINSYLTFSTFSRLRSVEGKELFIDLICKAFVETSSPEDDINKPTMSIYPPKTIEVIRYNYTFQMQKVETKP